MYGDMCVAGETGSPQLLEVWGVPAFPHAPRLPLYGDRDSRGVRWGHAVWAQRVRGGPCMGTRVPCALSVESPVLLVGLLIVFP